MNWSKEKPIAPGWYWWKRSNGKEFPIYVVDTNGHLEFEEDGTNLSGMEGEFAGPIPKPVDETSTSAATLGYLADTLTKERLAELRKKWGHPEYEKTHSILDALDELFGKGQP